MVEMRPVISTLLALLLAVHAAFGLCWRCAEVEAVDSTTVSCCCGCHTAPESADNRAVSLVCAKACQFECSGTCRFLKPERTSIEQPAAMQWIANITDAPQTTLSRSSVDSFQNGVPGSGGSPSLRLHLLHGLLLI